MLSCHGMRKYWVSWVSDGAVRAGVGTLGENQLIEFLDESLLSISTVTVGVDPQKGAGSSTVQGEFSVPKDIGLYQYVPWYLSISLKR